MPERSGPGGARGHGTTESWTAMQDETPHTQNPTECADPEIEIASEAKAADVYLFETSLDLEGNELHATGQTCARCGQAITADQDVRRTASGAYQHEICPH